MHTLLTDRLACPRCGSAFGLILFAERVEERRVYRGSLGCPNCRDRYPVEDGFADLRPQPRTPLPDPVTLERITDPEDQGALRLAALIGVAEGPGHLFLAGDPVRFAPALGRMLDKIEVVAANPSVRAWDEEAGVSRIVVRDRIPLLPRSLRGVALDGEAAAELLDEAARTVAPRGRVVVVNAVPGTGERVRERGLSVILEEEGVVVGTREGVEGGGPPPGTTPPGTGPLADGRLPVVP